MSRTHSDVPLQEGGVPAPVPSDLYHSSPATELLRRLGDRWTPLVLCLLGEAPRRFNELHRGIEDISQRMLTRTLRALERDGLVTRTVYPTVPPSVEYGLSPMGRSLLEPLTAVVRWADEHAAEMGEARDRFGMKRG